MAPLPTVREHMDHRVPTLRPETGILDAVAFLLKQKVTGAPVLDSAGKLVGIITEKDCLKLIATGIDANRPQGTVEKFMTPNPVTISPDMDVYYVAGLFLKSNFRRFPVVEDGKLVGAITRFDILRVIKVNLARST